MVQIKEISILSMSKLLAAVQGVFGLVAGLFLTLAYLIDPAFLQTSAGGVGALFGVWSVVMMPLINAVLGFMTGALLAGVYNLYVRLSGTGVSVTVVTVA